MAQSWRGWIVPWSLPTGLFIRDYLLKHGRAYPQEIWRALKNARKERGLHYCAYENFWRNYILILEKLGLIRRVGTQKAGHPAWFDEVLYEIVPGMENHEAWRHPQIAFDPRRGRADIRREYKRKKKERETTI